MKPWHESVRFNRPLREARLGAAWRLDDWEHQLHLREKAAFERGRIEGEKALSEQLMQQRRELIELQQGVFHALSQAVPQVARECEQSLVQLALAAVEKLVGSLPVSGEMIEAVVRQALEQVEEETEFMVLLHPEDLALLQRVNSPLILTEDHNQRIRFKESHEVTRGGCLVHTRFGVVDARRETKAELLRKTLQS
jgi:flagellar assembly protein FliH